MEKTFGSVKDSDNVLNILVSFVYLRNSNRMLDLWKFLLTRDPCSYRLLVDSGAYSVAHSGQEIYLEEYSQFLAKIPVEIPYRAIQLDVINFPERTLENYKRHLDLGEKVVPVLQPDASVAIREEIFSLSDLVAMAGGPRRKTVLDEITEYAKIKKAHFLGVTHPNTVHATRSWSGDSVAWQNGARYGILQLWDAKIQNFRKFYFTKDMKDIDQFTPLMVNMGLDRGEVLELNRWKKHAILFDTPYKSRMYRMPRVIGTWSYLKASHDMHQSLDFRMFLACTPDEVVPMFKIYDAQIQRGLWGR
jgi:hypothetical protein